MESVPLLEPSPTPVFGLPEDQPYSTLEKDEAESLVDSKERVNVSFFKYLQLVQQVVNRPWKSKLLLFVITIAPLFVQGLLVYLYSLLTVVPEVIVQGKKEGFIGGVIIPGIVIILVMSVIIVASTYCSNYLGVYWRKLLTDHVSNMYFQRRMYYYLNCIDTSMDNSDQRIAQDINTLTTTGIFVYSSVLGQLVALIMFSGATVLSPIGWKGLFVCYLFVLIAYIIAVPLTVRVTPYVFAEEKSEGYFRYAQARIRTYVESIAFYNGEEEELLNINNAFRNVLARSILVLRKQFPLNCYSIYMTSTRAYMGQLLIALQLFYGIFSSQSLDGQSVEEITKTILVISVYFTNIMTASMSLLSIASQISIFVGTVRRVGELMIVMSNLQNPDLEAFKNIPIKGKIIHNNNKVEFQNVTFYSPIGKLVVNNLSFQLDTSMIIMGPSGIGKSSVLRVLASLWPVHEGTVIRPLDVGRNGIMFLPQRPYMVIGGLKDQLLYPEKLNKDISTIPLLENKLRNLLELVKLEYLLDRVDGDWEKEVNWEDFLSLGEQQRIAFARLFYHNPHVAIIDEGTSALDIELESHIYNLLKSQSIKYLSVGHRPGLIEYHDQLLVLAANGEWKIDKASQDRVSYTFSAKSDRERVVLDDNIDVETTQNELHKNKDSIKKDIERIQKESQHQSINKEFWGRLKLLVSISSTNTKAVVIFIGLSILSIIYGIFSSYMNLLTAPLSLSIAQRDKHTFLYYILNHIIGWVIFSLMCGIFQYFGGVLTVYVRQQITSLINDKYFHNKTYYKLLTLPEKNDGNKLDNPDQRICNDVYGFALQFINIFFLYANGTNAMQGILPTLCTFFATIYYVRNMPFLPTLINAIIYTTANVLFMYWISVKISKWTFTQAKLQGTFRYSHARLRSYAESIAFYDGELQESKNITNQFDRVMENNYKLIFYQSLSAGGTVALLVLAESLGYFIIAITLLWISPISNESQDTTVLLNEFVTIFSASLLFNGALAGFTLSFNTLGQLGGYTNRVGELISKITHLDSSAEIKNSFIESVNTVSFDNVLIRNPANKIIAENLSFTVDKNTLITGPSGSGKSSVLRCLVGIWPIEKGVISKPFNLGKGGLFFLPQRPYMIIGNLRQQLVYPSHNVNAYYDLDAKLESLLKLFELDHILKRIDNNWDATLVWEEILSLGEQQRIAMARLFFQEPAVSILDECTSALSVESQQKFYELCNTKNMLLLSVGHRPELIQFHKQIIKYKSPSNWEIVEQ